MAEVNLSRVDAAVDKASNWIFGVLFFSMMFGFADPYSNYWLDIFVVDRSDWFTRLTHEWFGPGNLAAYLRGESLFWYAVWSAFISFATAVVLSLALSIFAAILREGVEEGGASSVKSIEAQKPDSEPTQD